MSGKNIEIKLEGDCMKVILNGQEVKLSPDRGQFFGGFNKKEGKNGSAIEVSYLSEEAYSCEKEFIKTIAKLGNAEVEEFPHDGISNKRAPEWGYSIRFSEEYEISF